MALRSLAVTSAYGSLAALLLLAGGCRGTEAGSTGDAVADAPSIARGVYALDGDAGTGAGDILVLSFVDTERYWLWKNTAECRDLTVLHDSCEEWGRYAVEAKTLTLTADAPVAARSYPFAIGAATASASATATASSALHAQAGELVGGSSGGALVGPGQQVSAATQPVASNVTVGGSAMAFVRRGVELLTKCEARQEGSGAIPGAPSPSSNYANGVFSSGDFAPGGQYDPRTAASGAPTLYRDASLTDHQYALLSDRLPAGTTFAQANAALQRFNGPTGPALSGQGDDPNSTAGWVVDPLTGEIPVGCVTFERGNGWARNTTQAVHPFVGTITRYVVDSGNGSYRILTVGAGVTPPSGGDSMGDRLVRTAQETISGARNLGNVVGGPAIFRALDRQLIGSVHP